MCTGLVIRSAIIKDANALADLRAAVLSESPFLLEVLSEIVNDPQRMAMQIERFNTSGMMLVADLNSEIVGMLTFGRSSFKKIQHRGGIMMLVSQKYRGQGIGRSLLEKFLELAKSDSSLYRLDLSVMSGNHNAIKMYEKTGFVHEGRRAHAYQFSDGSFQDEIYMGLLLRS